MVYELWKLKHGGKSVKVSTHRDRAVAKSKESLLKKKLKSGEYTAVIAKS